MDDDDEVKAVPTVNQINDNNYNVVNNSKNNEEAKKNLFDEDINEDEVTLKTTVNTKVVQATKKLQASYNDYANKIVKAAQEKSAKENF